MERLFSKYRICGKKGYNMNECILISTSNPDEKYLEGSYGFITVVNINGVDYFSFVTKDMQVSFRHKIIRRLNDLSLPICSEAYYMSGEGYEYTFQSTQNKGNPLWEMEHGELK